MMYETIFKQMSVWIGLPGAIILAAILTLEFGMTPIDTVSMRTEKAATLAANVLKGEHLIQAEKLLAKTEELQVRTDRTLNALKEICFNTASNDEAKRRCGAL
jgi:hypothetical protein